MKLKKISILTLALLTSSLVLAACGQKKEADSKAQNEKSVDINKDAIDTKTKTVNGKEVKEYTMPDGNVVQIPADGEVPDSSGSAENGDSSSSQE
ncbi:hypothetical protein [Streptococcus oricebi]|uniref:ATP-binding cassette lipoprotein n=1 Tax=Streptococcus oricebi TaxID=1547447 RepID=A0ABS5B108_9STRE|nr:hypothetical protein [Streptococcus oricebi]MBP2622507.1 hypothetical protein [Streptococcus oricebi]